MEDLATLDTDILSQVGQAPEPTDLKKSGPALAHPEKPKETQEKPEAPALAPPEKPPEPAQEKPKVSKVGPQVENPSPFSDPLTTKDGYLYDPRLIQTGKDGTPRTTPGGHWLLKKKGWEKALEEIHRDQALAIETTQEEKPPEETNKETNNPPEETNKQTNNEPEPLKQAPTIEPPPLAGGETPQGEQEPPPLLGLDDPGKALENLPNREIAELISDTFVFKGMSIVGEEFAPMVVDPKTGHTDRDRMVDRWENYLKTTNTAENLPPWSVPLLSMVTYTTTRAMKPKSKTQGFILAGFKRAQAKVKIWALWVKAKFTGKTTGEVLEDQEAEK